MREVTIINETTGTTLGARIGCADSSLTRLVGLLGRSGLEAGRGIWISPSSGVHTLGMRFAIDVIGLDREMRVVRLWPNLKPFRITSVNLQIKSVLEMAAGQIADHSIAVGHKLKSTPCSAL